MFSEFLIIFAVKYSFKMEQTTALTPKEIGRKVAAYFKEKKISQEEVATRLGFASKQVVANQMSGKKFGRIVAAKYAREFGFNEIFLLTGMGDLFNPEPENELQRLRVENQELRAVVLSQQETIHNLTSRP